MGEICYKGFEKGLICRGKQYKENTVFEEEKAIICNSGIHYCKNPFDVFDFYNVVNNDGSFNEFAEVEPLAEELTNDNKKFCTTKIKVGNKMNFADFIKICVDFVNEKTQSENENFGDYAKIGSSGYSAKIGSSGYSAKIGSSGDSAKISSSGDYAKISSSGDYAKISSSGSHSVVMCAGNGSIAKAKNGSFITLSEWGYNETGAYIPFNIKTAKVDGESIKENTYYKLINGEFVEVEP